MSVCVNRPSGPIAAKGWHRLKAFQASCYDQRANIVVGAIITSNGRAFANLSLVGGLGMQPVAKALGAASANIRGLSTLKGAKVPGRYELRANRRDAMMSARPVVIRLSTAARVMRLCTTSKSDGAKLQTPRACLFGSLDGCERRERIVRHVRRPENLYLIDSRPQEALAGAIIVRAPQLVSGAFFCSALDQTKRANNST
jgi:hypothetical protein